jgi:hypothetical protein
MMIVHANTSSEAEATLEFFSNWVTRSSDFSLTLTSEQLTALSWSLTLHNNTFTRGDRYVGVKAYKVMGVREAAVLKMEEVGFEELRTGQVCNTTREESAITYFISPVNVTKISMPKITYDKVTIG